MMKPAAFIISSGYVDFACGHQGYLLSCFNKDDSIHKSFIGNLNMTKIVEFRDGFDTSKCAECWFVDKNK